MVASGRLCQASTSDHTLSVMVLMAWPNLHPVQVPQRVLDVPRAHTLRVHPDDLLFQLAGVAGVFPHHLRLEVPVPVTRHLDAGFAF